MADIYMPGVTSRFNTDKLIEDLMRVERIPRERTEKNVESLETQKTYWQDVGRRISSLRDSSRILFSFQNPFNDRIVRSSDESVITGTASREATQQERSFIVKQTAQADRFLSSPLAESFRVEAGSYTFTLGEQEISFDFRGGGLRDFTELLNRRGRDRIRASTVTVEPGSRSLLIESLVTGAANRLGFSGDAEGLALRTGITERVDGFNRDIAVAEASLRNASAEGVSISEETLRVNAGSSASVAAGPGLQSRPNLVLSLETATEVRPGEDIPPPQPPPGPAIAPSGSAAYGGITIENDQSTVPIPPWTPPPPPVRVDNLRILSLTFSDGTKAALPPLRDTGDFSASQYRLSDIAGDRTISSIDIQNDNTHRDLSLRNIRVFDPTVLAGVRPKNPISAAQDAVVVMDGIEVKRPGNTIEDLIPGLSLTARSPSSRPVLLGVEPDLKSVKDGIISLVGNYNRLMAELNVLTRNDDRIIQELSYMDPQEQEALRSRLGVFSGDSTLNQFKGSLQRVTGAPYPTVTERDLSMLTQIGIGTDVRRAGAGSGYDPSRLRGYLEIDERILDNALETRLPSVQQLFGMDTDGDLIIDSGIAYALDNVVKPFVESGGILSLKTGTIDSRISQDQRRMETLDRQLAAKEAALKLQYGQMEGAYTRMEQMSTSLEQFSQRNKNNN